MQIQVLNILYTYGAAWRGGWTVADLRCTHPRVASPSVAYYMNGFENHRTYQQYENSLIAKLFAFK